MRQLGHYTSLMLALVIMGCNAPRDNPYDPNSENYIGSGASAISGRVTTYTGQGLEGAALIAFPEDAGPVRGAYSNFAGYYTITNLSLGTYSLHCTLSGFAADCLIVDVPDTGLIPSQNFILNGLPVIHNLSVTSRYINTFSIPSLYYQVRAYAELTLPDGVNDIDSVLLKTQLGLQWPMNFYGLVQDTLSYFVSINESTLPGGSIGGITGHYFICSVLDTAGVNVDSEPATILRFLIAVPYTFSPGYNEDVYTPNPWLVWDLYSANFYFTYTARIYNNDGLAPVLFWEQSNISADVDSLVAGYLPNGQYFWNLEVTDEFGNSAVSLDAGFRVIHP